MIWIIHKATMQISYFQTYKFCHQLRTIALRQVFSHKKMIRSLKHYFEKKNEFYTENLEPSYTNWNILKCKDVYKRQVPLLLIESPKSPMYAPASWDYIEHSLSLIHI